MSEPGDKNVDVKQDDLLFCLTHLAKKHGKAHSSRSLTAGLPLENGKLTPVLFVRSLQRLNLQGIVFKKPLPEITTDYVPCILLLSDDRACYVEKITDEGI